MTKHARFISYAALVAVGVGVSLVTGQYGTLAGVVIALVTFHIVRRRPTSSPTAPNHKDDPPSSGW